MNDPMKHTDRSFCNNVLVPALLAMLIAAKASADLVPPPDVDADGVPDSADNCLFVPNAPQRDTDNDGFGNLCDADFNNDGATNFVDLADLKANFFGASELHDLDGDGAVNFIDLAKVKEIFFRPPGPSGKITACIGEACDSPLALCEEGTEPPLLVLAWDQLPEPDTLATLGLGSLLPLTVSNKASVTLFVDVQVTTALDAVRRTIDLGTSVIGPFSTLTLLVNPADFIVDLSALDFAGRLVARARARLTPSGPVERMAYTPHAFLHVDGGSIQFYRKFHMLESFGAGDYQDIALSARRWAEQRGLQVMGVGHAGRLVLTDDDGGPREQQ